MHSCGLRMIASASLQPFIFHKVEMICKTPDRKLQCAAARHFNRTADIDHEVLEHKVHYFNLLCLMSTIVCVKTSPGSTWHWQDKE
jgi:hypothetical protein